MNMDSSSHALTLHRYQTALIDEVHDRDEGWRRVVRDLDQ